METDGIDLEGIADLKVIELKVLLRERGLTTDGKKAVLVSRLKEFLQSELEENNKRKLEEEAEEFEPNKKQKLEHQGEEDDDMPPEDEPEIGEEDGELPPEYEGEGFGDGQEEHIGADIGDDIGEEEEIVERTGEDIAEEIGQEEEIGEENGEEIEGLERFGVDIIDAEQQDRQDLDRIEGDGGDEEEAEIIEVGADREHYYEGKEELEGLKQEDATKHAEPPKQQPPPLSRALVPVKGPIGVGRGGLKPTLPSRQGDFAGLTKVDPVREKLRVALETKNFDEVDSVMKMILDDNDKLKLKATRLQRSHDDLVRQMQITSQAVNRERAHRDAVIQQITLEREQWKNTALAARSVQQQQSRIPPVPSHPPPNFGRGFSPTGSAPPTPPISRPIPIKPNQQPLGRAMSLPSTPQRSNPSPFPARPPPPSGLTQSRQQQTFTNTNASYYPNQNHSYQSHQIPPPYGTTNNNYISSSGQGSYQTATYRR